MFKKSFIALTVLISVVAFASEKKHEFKKGTHEGYIYTGNENKTYTQTNINNQWANNPQPKEEKTYVVQGYKIVSNQGSSDCIIN